MAVKEVTDLDSIGQGNVLVDFYTSTCAPCKAMNPVLEEIAAEYSDLTVAKIEMSKNPSASYKFQIMAVPTLMIMKDSKVKAVSKGLSSKNQITSLIEQHLGINGKTGI